MQITFLGTACMVPTKDRNHSGIFVSYKAHGILMDCGEGVQRQFRIAEIPPTKITKILISHWHGDHVLGLPGLIQTLSASEYEKTLEIYGPKGTKEYINSMFKAFAFNNTLDIKINELAKDGVFFENDEFVLEAFSLNHSIPCFGFSFIEKDKIKINLAFTKKLKIPEGPLLGKLQDNKSIVWKGETITPEHATYTVKGIKVTYVSDTLPCTNSIKYATNANILICEASHASSHEEKAMQYGHATAKQAAMIASQANAKRLILTHFSQRYKDVTELKEEAKDIFCNVDCAYDFMKIKL